MGSTTGSIIITVKGKEVYVGTAPPSSPVDNELWLDISENNVLKYYKASTKTWCVVNDVSEKFGDVYKYLQTNYYTKTETNNAVKEEIGKTTIIKKDGTVVNMKDAINSVIDTATEHTQKIEDINSKYNSVTGEITEVKTSTSEIKQDLNGFKTTVSENYVGKTEFNNMSVGGTNLLLATKDFGIISTSNGNWAMSTDDDGFAVASRAGNGSWIELQTITTIDAKDNPQAGNTLVLAFDAKADDLETSPLNYTLALKVYGSNDGFKTWKSAVYTECYIDGSSSRYIKVLSGTRQNDKWCRLSYIVTIPTTFNSGSWGTYNEYRYGMGVYTTRHNTGHTLSVRKFKMSFGNVPSDWSPAPEDYETRISSAESKIEQNADSIKNTVRKDGVISAINQTAEEITINANKLNLNGYLTVVAGDKKYDTKGSANAIQVGGRNILLHSKFNSNGDKWLESGNIKDYVVKDGRKCAHINHSSLKETKTIKQSILDKLEPNTQYTMSGWVLTENLVKGTTNYFCAFYCDGYYSNNGTSTWYGYGSKSFPTNAGKWTHLEWTFSTDSKLTTAASCNMMVHTRDLTGDIYFSDLKLEKGNKATDWTAAPEDSDNIIDSIQNSSSEANTKADNANIIASESKKLIDEIIAKISMLVIGENGKTLWEQTDKGWSFNFYDVSKNLNDVSNNLTQYKPSIDAFNTIQPYIRYTTIFNDSDKLIPCIELGSSDSIFKIRITNEEIQFMEGDIKVAYINNNSLHIGTAIINDSLRIGNLSIVKRASGNVGFGWA